MSGAVASTGPSYGASWQAEKLSPGEIAMVSVSMWRRELLSIYTGMKSGDVTDNWKMPPDTFEAHFRPRVPSAPGERSYLSWVASANGICAGHVGRR